MKTILATLTALALLGASHTNAMAGDREWATAGKIITGVVAGAALAKAFEPASVYHATPYYPAPVVYAPPPPVYVQTTRVVVHTPPRVVYTPAPVVYVQAPVVYAPAPVMVHRAPVYVAPRPAVSFHFGVGHRHHAPPVYRVCR